MANVTTILLGPCQVRSRTDDPCLRPAVVKIRGVPFCESCAHEQEAYFAIGELTENPQHFHHRSLVGMLDKIRQTRGRRGVKDQGSEAA